MKQLNKKAAECTAIHPTAKENDLDRSFTQCNVTQNNQPEKTKNFELAEVSRISGVRLDEFIQFFTIRGYICKESYGYSATALGIERGCVVNDDKYNALFTMKAIIRVANTWNNWYSDVEEGRKLFEERKSEFSSIL